MHGSCLQILVDLLARYTKNLGIEMQRRAECCNRTEANLVDVQRVFAEVGITMKELEDYVDNFDSEVNTIKAFLSMQSPASAPAINPNTVEINAEDYVAPRFSRKMKSKLRQKILEAHANVKDLNLLEAKMNFK